MRRVLSWILSKIEWVMFLFVALTSVVLILASFGCGPPQGSAPRQFILVVHSNDVGFVDTAVVTWWRGSAVVGSSTVVVPAGPDDPRGGHPAQASIFMGPDAPDGFEVDVEGAWSAPNGAVWGRPDYAKWSVFHVVYPTGSSWGEWPR